MKHYFITFNYGYGDEHDFVEASSMSEAQDIAYEHWREGAESQADYKAQELSDAATEYGYESEQELLEDYGVQQ